MNSLLDKVGALISINVRSLIGQTHRSKNAASFFRHYMSVEQNLIDIETSLTHLGKEMEEVIKRGRQSEDLVERLDKIVDEFLINGDNSSARKAQLEWNHAKRINIEFRAQIRDLDRQRENLLRAKDKLEVQLMLMQEEKERLQELYRQYQEDHVGVSDQGQHQEPSHGTQEKVYWVVDPV